MQHPAWALVIVGGLIAAVGLIWLIAPSIPWLGKLRPDEVQPQNEEGRKRTGSTG